MSVLHPLQQTDPNIMDDTDLAGPFVFCIAFGAFLLLVSLLWLLFLCCVFILIQSGDTRKCTEIACTTLLENIKIVIDNNNKPPCYYWHSRIAHVGELISLKNFVAAISYSLQSV